jgi:hypothetical protein
VERVPSARELVFKGLVQPSGYTAAACLALAGDGGGLTGYQ